MSNAPFRIAIAITGASFCAPVSAQVTHRVSLDSAGAQANGQSFDSAISTDGRYVAFASNAPNLVPGDTNGLLDIFVRDLWLGTTQRVSVGAGGAQANGASFDPSISADGRYVSFTSAATNLVAGDTNGRGDVFVRDRLSATTERVSLDSSGAEGNGDSYESSISADGSHVAFTSGATNLVPADLNGWLDIFVRDRLGATTELASVDSAGTQGDGNSLAASISTDGQYVAFRSVATNLVPADVNGSGDIFVRDRSSSTTERVSVSSGGAEGNGDSFDSAISADGRFVAFGSFAANLVPGDTNGNGDIFLRDLLSSTTELVSVDSGGALANQSSGEGLSVTIDGRYVAFVSSASNLVPGDTNGWEDIFVRDRLTGTTERASVNSGGGQAFAESFSPTISADGRYVAFSNPDLNLVPGDSNGVYDVFVRERGGGTLNLSISVGLAGVPGNGDSFDPSISADGRYVAFSSIATNLVVGDTNGLRDIFVRDRAASTTTRVSVSSGGTESNDVSSNPSISADGRFVAFDSLANNLVPGDTNAWADVFRHDLVTGATTRVSVDSLGLQGNGSSTKPACSGDGSAIAFESVATNLVLADTNGASDIFVRSGLTSLVTVTARASVSSSGIQGNGSSVNASISANGALVAFDSAAPNLVLSDTNSSRDVFVRNLGNLQTARWSVASGGAQADGDSSNAMISGDGGRLAFQSSATNLVPGDTNLSVDVFVRDGQVANTVRVSVDSGGTQGLGAGSSDPSTSVDGRHTSFASAASNLVAGDTNGAPDVFVHDRLTGPTRRASVDTSGIQGSGASGGSAISADGRYIVFDSMASNLVLGDTNGARDVFLRDEGTVSAFESFCPGDGSVAPCPCGNSGTAGRGCQNSGSTGGALLRVTGVANLSADTVQFTSSGEKPTALSIFLQGSTVIAPITYGDGLRCTGGNLKRLFTKTAVGGVAVAPQTGELSISARSAQLNAPIPLGATRPYQVYYRDGVAGFCPDPPGSSFNVSNGFLVAWGR